MKKKLSYTTAALLISAMSTGFLAISPALAQEKQTNFTDVSAGAWYEDSTRALVDLDALDDTAGRLRPNDLATRADVVQTLVRLHDQPLMNPSVGSFNDVARTSSYYQYFETAASAGWVKGDGNCYKSRPCYARPNGFLNRAEAAALLVRAFALPSTGTAPAFMDNADRNQWYYQPIQTAADHCILQGDDFSKLVRPASNMNRAEMIVMMHRAYQNLNYSEDCSPTDPAPTADISTSVALSATKIRLTFTGDLEDSTADDASRYEVEAVNGPSLNVTAATVVGDRVVDLTVSGNLTNQYTYRVNANNLRTAGGRTFSATDTFPFTTVTPRVLDVTTLANNRVRIRFDSDLESGVANDAFRYVVRDVSAGTNLSVQTATVIDARTVELALASNLQTNRQYRLTGTDLESTSGTVFSTDNTFTWNQLMPNTSTITFISPTVIRVTSNVDLDESLAEDKSRWLVRGNNTNVTVTKAELISSRVVELTLATPVESQRSYTVTASNVMTSGGVGFTSSGALVYSGADVTLRTTLAGSNQMPPVTTAATGTGTFTLGSNGLQYTIFYTGIPTSNVTGAHFHRGAAGTNGPVIQTITFSNNVATGTWANLTEQDRNDILNGNVYVNIHTTAYPDGEIRGQVIR